MAISARTPVTEGTQRGGTARPLGTLSFEWIGASPAPVPLRIPARQRSRERLTIEELPVAMRPPIPSLTLSRRAKIGLGVVGTLIVVLIVLGSLIGVYVNWLWFGEVGYRGVYRTIIGPSSSCSSSSALLMALIIGGNIVVAYMLRPPFRPMSRRAAEPRALPGRCSSRARSSILGGIVVHRGPQRRYVGAGRTGGPGMLWLQRRHVRHQGSAVPP